MKKNYVTAAVMVLLSVPGFAAKPQIQWNDAYDFSQLESFMWRETAGQSLERADPFLHNHIINTIEFHLSSSGLTEVESNPDVLVTYYGSIDTEVNLQSDVYGYGWGGYGGPGWARHGYGTLTPVAVDTRIVEYDRGTLVVDIIDADTSELVWRGTATGLAVSDDPDKNRRTVEKTLAAMVKQSKKLRERAQGD